MPKSGCGAVTSMPLICTTPLVARMRPPTILRNVVLPQPLGPSRVTSVRGIKSKETAAIATNGPWSARGNSRRTSRKRPNAPGTDVLRPDVSAPGCCIAAVALAVSGRDPGIGKKAGGIDVRGGGRRAGHADVFGDEIHRRLHLCGIEPAQAMLLHVGGHRQIAHDVDFRHDDVGLQ